MTGHAGVYSCCLSPKTYGATLHDFHGWSGYPGIAHAGPGVMYKLMYLYLLINLSHGILHRYSAGLTVSFASQDICCP